MKNVHALHPCAHCKRAKGKHQANTFNCPLTGHAFTHFHKTQVFQPNPDWKPKPKPFTL